MLIELKKKNEMIIVKIDFKMKQNLNSVLILIECENEIYFRNKNLSGKEIGLDGPPYTTKQAKGKLLNLGEDLEGDLLN